MRPFAAAVVDEAQDIGVPQLRFLAALAGDRPNPLFFAGDLGQRIFQTPFSWRSLGVDVLGRSHTLRLNYRTSHQIRRQADLLLPPELSDVDGDSEQRRGAVSAFNGPFPTITTFASHAEESRFVGAWLRDRLSDGVPPDGMGIIVRSKLEMDRAIAARHSDIGEHTPAQLQSLQEDLYVEWIRGLSEHLRKSVDPGWPLPESAAHLG